MNFSPRYLPYGEALRIVAERAEVKTGQINPLKLALDEGAIVPELRINGEWKKASNGEWGKLRVWFPAPIVLSHQQPEWDDQIAHTDVRIETSEIDKFWPVTDAKKASNKGGAPFAADWSALEGELAKEIASVGFPDKNGVPGWQSKADVVRWVEARLGKDEPGKSALKDNVNRMLGNIAKKAGN